MKVEIQGGNVTVKNVPGLSAIPGNPLGGAGAVAGGAKDGVKGLVEDMAIKEGAKALTGGTGAGGTSLKDGVKAVTEGMAITEGAKALSGGTTLKDGAKAIVDGVTAQAIGNGNSATVNTGGMGSGVQSQGVTVINGEVWIDGEKVPENARHFTSKAGHRYSIDRSNGGARVTSE